MKKAIPLLFLLCVSLYGCSEEGQTTDVQSEEQQNETESDENIQELVLSIVDHFGYQLEKVSLMAPITELKKSMNEQYGAFVSPELIAKWLEDPLHAPGRLTSSPWPDRIDVTDIKRLSDKKYSVEGEIVEVTSSQEIADKKPIRLTVEEVDGKWKITDTEIMNAEDSDQIVYVNPKYGFNFKLPISWQDYSIVEDEWEGLSANGDVIEKGPMISIRHPKWTAEQPRQDIPIMVFKIDQWEAMQAEKFHIGAAPIGPKELARNDQYVFALPARYNFAFPTGYEEVEEIVEQHPIEVQ